MTPEEVRARVDAMEPRVLPGGAINARHVALESTLRERNALPAYIPELDGPGRFRPAPPDLLADFGRKALAILLDPASWQPGLVHDLLSRRRT